MSGHQNGPVQRAADGLKAQIGDIAAEAARNAVDANLDEAAARIESRYGGMIDPAAEAVERVMRTVNAYPIASVLGACAVGFTLGRMRLP